ncbi:MAG: hypothetical protein R8K46_11310 [Mariprofundaceae bacterium]
MRQQMDKEERARERKKVIGGLVLGLAVFIYFLVYLFSQIPD